MECFTKRMKAYKDICMLSLGCLVVCLSLTACGDDDDEPQGGTVEIGVPPSVVDGVRSSEVGGIGIVYNEDGTINYAEMEDGTEFKFNYASTRAGTRPLNSITATYSVDDVDESAYQKADNFLISNGLIAGYRFESKYSDGDYFEKSSILYRITYDSSNRISKIDMSATFEDSEEGPYSTSGVYSYAYGQNGELTKITGSTENTEVYSQTFQYGQQFRNKFNIMLPFLMSEDLISEDNVFVILGLGGYLGNTSTQLPTQVACRTTDPDDGEVDTWNWNMDYSFAENESIKWYEVDGEKYPCGFIGVDEDTDIEIH